MRERLQKSNGRRGTFTGTFERTGIKTSFGHPKETVLLRDIRDEGGAIVTDHVWMNMTAGFRALDLRPGDVVRFDARVRPYTKGYRGHREDVYRPVEVDYKLSHPTRMVKVEPNAEQAALPYN